MRKTIARILTVSMLAVLMAAMLTAMSACGGGGAGGAATTQAAAATTEAQAAATTAAPAATTEAPAAEAAPATIIWYVPGDKADEHDLVIGELNKKLLDLLNVQLDFRMLTFGEYADKMKLTSTSGEDFDLEYTSNWLNSFVDNIARSALLPLDDLLAQYGKELYASVPEWLFDAGRAGKDLYGIPNYQMVGDYYGVYIQKELADKYDLDPSSITEFEDLEPFLMQIRDNEPEMFPLLKQQNPKMWPIYERFIGGLLYMKKGDETMTILPPWEAMNDEWSYNNWLYKEKLIREDIATVIDDSPYQLSNRFAATLNIAKPGGEAEATARYQKEYIQIPVSKCYIAYDSGVSTVTAISSTSSHPEEAMKFLNLMYTNEELFNMLLFGLEGQHYTKAGPNRVDLIEGSKYFYGGQAWAFGNQLLAWYVPGQEDGTWEETQSILDSAEVSVVRGFYFDPESVQSEIAQLDAVGKEFERQDYVTDDLETWKSDYINKLKAAGIEKVIAEFQRQVDEWAVSVGKK